MPLSFSPDIINKAEELYSRLKPTIEKKSFGQYIAIDPLSSEYFIAPKLTEAIKLGQLKLPGREFFTRRIGFKEVASFSSIHLHMQP